MFVVYTLCYHGDRPVYNTRSNVQLTERVRPCVELVNIYIYKDMYTRIVCNTSVCSAVLCIHSKFIRAVNVKFIYLFWELDGYTIFIVGCLSLWQMTISVRWVAAAGPIQWIGPMRASENERMGKESGSESRVTVINIGWGYEMNHGQAN